MFHSKMFNTRKHYGDIIMGTIASQITRLTTVYSTVYSDANQRKHQSSASLAFVRGIHWGPVNSPHKWPVTRKLFPFDDVIMIAVHPNMMFCCVLFWCGNHLETYWSLDHGQQNTCQTGKLPVCDVWYQWNQAYGIYFVLSFPIMILYCPNSCSFMPEFSCWTLLGSFSLTFNYFIPRMDK